MKNYVKEYKGYKVPEGATHYGNSHPVAYFYKFNAAKIPFFYLNHEWKRSSACDVYIKDNLTELPEVDEKKMDYRNPLLKNKQEWNGEGLPPIDTVCECFVWTSFSGGEKRWVPLPVIGHSKTSRSETHKGKSGIVVDSCEQDGKFVFCDEFRPLKTQQEKECEAFIAEGLIAAKESVDGWGEDEATAFLEDLFNDGARFTAPKAGDNGK